ncbi:MAG: nitrite reductase large subunit [Nitrospirae bacterium CG18_big_fil_WC_8_21_14_2_50_70_55]|nr:MAG: nitrite reductase large subunit [Nitrospirae bacterium CG18_big_fil_WC_8_21_14_2_50_70_55]
MRKKLVLVGNGMAGVRTLEELLKLAPEAYDITVFGAEPHGNYNRILLSPVLAGEKRLDEIMLNDEAWYTANGITLYKGKTVTEIDRARRRVIADDGTTASYDRLLLATGSLPIVLPIPGHDLPGVVTFREIRDVDRMLEVALTHRHAVVIGGGLLGLEAANGLMKQGMEVTVVHLMETLMERQLDVPAANMLRRSLEEKGLRFVMPAQTEAILGNGRVSAVRLADGTEIDADLVVMAVGIRPNIHLARSTGIYCERGIVVNDTLQTYDPRIYALGECVQHRNTTYGLVAPLFEQGKVCANHLAGLGYWRYEGSKTSTKLKVTGIDLFSAGDFIGDDSTEEIYFKDIAGGVYKKLALRDDRITGAVLYGDTADGSWYFQLMREGADISDLREHLLFGQRHLGDAGHGDINHAVVMTDDQEVCGCNGVCKGDIIKAITSKGLFTLEEVRAHTKASSSCGSCTGLVEQILAHTLGGEYSAPGVKPLCKCTDFTHDQVRKAIREHQLQSLAAVMHFLEWKSPDGCPACRPALNFYLLVAWPGEYHDEGQSRYINERVHANIQKDGSYSVVPRVFGGITNPAQLRALADVAERFQVPEVKFTGGSRIDLLGVKKEQLPAIWADLAAAGFVSGHAYGKAVRTVKCCVGSDWCRFGTQDSTTMAIAIEKMTWGSWTPHKFKMGVSGCPRNCAEATIKDLGVVAVESGWEIHVGGNGGVKVRATDLLCHVTTMDEVLEYTGAFLQLYREEARYLERTAPWLERVGISYLKERLVADGASQVFAQQDPWGERGCQGVDRHEFIPLKVLA